MNSTVQAVVPAFVAKPAPPAERRRPPAAPIELPRLTERGIEVLQALNELFDSLSLRAPSIG